MFSWSKMYGFRSSTGNRAGARVQFRGSLIGLWNDMLVTLVSDTSILAYRVIKALPDHYFIPETFGTSLRYESLHKRVSNAVHIWHFNTTVTLS